MTFNFKKGQKVKIYNTNLQGERFVEGTGTIKDILQGDNQGVYCDIIFDDEKHEVYQRWIFASEQ